MKAFTRDFEITSRNLSLESLLFSTPIQLTPFALKKFSVRKLIKEDEIQGVLKKAWMNKTLGIVGLY